MTNRSRILSVALSLIAGVTASRVHADTKPAAPTSTSSAPYQIDAKRSRFIVETQTSGLSTMFAHDHRIEVRDFGGQAAFGRDLTRSGSLQLKAKAKSLVLIGEDNLGARQAVESTLREDVLETDKYPEITFKTKSVTSSRRGDGTFDVRLTGELNLHGVKRQVTVPARVSLEGSTLHAIGVLELRQTDFKITPFSFANGTVGIKDAVTISFDILATQT